MNNFGVNYDTGIDYCIPHQSPIRPTKEEIRYDFRAIREDLHANAIRLYGSDVRTMLEAARVGLEQGLNVWLSPRLVNGTHEESLQYVEECAREFERLRGSSDNPELVFVVGTEFTLDTHGLVSGATIQDRARALFAPYRMLLMALHVPALYRKQLNALIRDAAAIARKHFTGRITYAAGLWESVDWSMFDIVGVNYYRAAFNERSYVAGLRTLHESGKPVAITEFGCCCYVGADKKGPGGHNIVDWSAVPPRLKGIFTRSEATQARLITELLDIYEKEGVDSAFIFDFIGRASGHNADPQFDLDIASYGIVANLSARASVSIPIEKRWRPKEAYASVAAVFEKLDQSRPTHRSGGPPSAALNFNVRHHLL